MTEHTIWQPRWHDRMVLVMDFRIAKDNVITFTKAKSMEGKWYIGGELAKSFPTEQMDTKDHKKVTMRVIPLSILEPYEAGEL